jgi:hypothetical protein
LERLPGNINFANQKTSVKELRLKHSKQTNVLLKNAITHYYEQPATIFLTKNLLPVVVAAVIADFLFLILLYFPRKIMLTKQFFYRTDTVERY